MGFYSWQYSNGAGDRFALENLEWCDGREYGDFGSNSWGGECCGGWQARCWSFGGTHGGGGAPHGGGGAARGDYCYSGPSHVSACASRRLGLYCKCTRARQTQRPIPVANTGCMYGARRAKRWGGWGAYTGAVCNPSTFGYFGYFCTAAMYARGYMDLSSSYRVDRFFLSSISVPSSAAKTSCTT